MNLSAAIKLNSFLNILVFVGQGIDRVEEFDVAKDSRTPEPIGDKPRRTMAIRVTEKLPPAGVPKTFYNGNYYTLAESLWDRKAFIVLNILFPQHSFSSHRDRCVPCGHSDHDIQVIGENGHEVKKKLNTLP